MAASEIKQSLRKLDFPYCAREALCRIGLLFNLKFGRLIACFVLRVGLCRIQLIVVYYF